MDQLSYNSEGWGCKIWKKWLICRGMPLIPNWFSKICSQIGYSKLMFCFVNSKLMLRWDSPFNTMSPSNQWGPSRKAIIDVAGCVLRSYDAGLRSAAALQRPAPGTGVGSSEVWSHHHFGQEPWPPPMADRGWGMPPRRGGPFRETEMCWVLKRPEKLKWASSIDPKGHCRSERTPLGPKGPSVGSQRALCRVWEGPLLV